MTLAFLLIKHNFVLGSYALLLKLNRRLKSMNVILSFRANLNMVSELVLSGSLDKRFDT
jgi:hypothetical protein